MGIGLIVQGPEGRDNLLTDFFHFKRMILLDLRL